MNEFIESVIELAGSNNTHTRIEASNFLKEGYKWDKESILKAIEGLRPIQKEELKRQFIGNTELIEPVRRVKSGRQNIIPNEETKKTSEPTRDT